VAASPWQSRTLQFLQTGEDGQIEQQIFIKCLFFLALGKKVTNFHNLKVTSSM
jgi:hypothetical protein